MIKIRIALATAFVAASVLGASAQKSVQTEIEKAERTCLSEAGCRPANCVGTVCARNACNDTVCPNNGCQANVCGNAVCANTECVNTECAKTDCRRAKTDCRKARTECRKAKFHCHKGRGGKHHAHRRGGDLFAELNLTPEQQTQIDALFAKRKEQARANKAENAEEKAARKAEKAEKKAASRQEFEAELQKILTPEQYITFKAKRANDMKSARPFGTPRKAKMAGRVCEKGPRCAKDSVKIGEVQKARVPRRI